MTFAALRTLIVFAFLCGALCGSAEAGVQLNTQDTLDSTTGTVTGTVNDTTGSVTGTVNDTTGSVTGTVNDTTGSVTGTVNDTTGSVTGTVNDTTGSVTGGSGSGSVGGSSSSLLDSATGSITTGVSGSSGSGGGGSSSSGGSGSNAGSGGGASRASGPRTKFDRLPRRYERLLERIESGDHVRANIARLRALLSTASPSFRKHLLRLIRKEMHRLRAGGLTHRERAALRRLTTLLKALEVSGQPAQISSRSLTENPASATTFVSGGIESIRTRSFRSERPASTRPDESDSTGLLPLPVPSPPGLVYWLPLLLAGLAVFLWLAARSPRDVLPSAVRGFVEVRAAEVLGLGALIAIVGAVWALLIQLLLP